MPRGRASHGQLAGGEVEGGHVDPAGLALAGKGGDSGRNHAQVDHERGRPAGVLVDGEREGDVGLSAFALEEMGLPAERQPPVHGAAGGERVGERDQLPQVAPMRGLRLLGILGRRSSPRQRQGGRGKGRHENDTGAHGTSAGL